MNTPTPTRPASLGRLLPRKRVRDVLAVLAMLLLAVSYVMTKGYNSMVSSRGAVDAASADLEVQLQRRFDLVPNLVASVKGALAQEKAVIDSVTQARARYAAAASPDERIAAANGLESALSRLLVVVENYPQVASLQNVRDLQVQLEGTENRVAQARREYNAAATSYNVAITRFPRSVLAGVFNFEKVQLFQADTAADEAPQVDLLPGS